jgi:hypothetical protein
LVGHDVEVGEDRFVEKSVRVRLSSRVMWSTRVHS